ncbi:hypothetical protein LINPERPRIM_LOCUS15392 [Linum perenne]
MPGRPKKARQREPAELIGRPRRSGGGVQLSRRGMIMHCRKCKGEGHNSQNCPRSVPEGEPEGGNDEPAAAEVPEPSNARSGVRRRLSTTETPPAVNDPQVRVEPVAQGDNVVHEPGRRKNKCKTCGFQGHNSRTCPTKSGVQPMTLNVQARRVVARETDYAHTGYGVAYFLDTGNTYYTNGNGSGGQGPTPMVTRRGAGAATEASNDLTPVRGTQPGNETQ